jgi:hypothetical protein
VLNCAPRHKIMNGLAWRGRFSPKFQPQQGTGGRAQGGSMLTMLAPVWIARASA